MHAAAAPTCDWQPWQSPRFPPSPQVYDQERQEASITLADWASVRGIKFSKCSASNAAIPLPTSGGLQVSSLVLDMPRPPSQLDLGLLDDFLFSEEPFDATEFGAALGKRAALGPSVSQPDAKRVTGVSSPSALAPTAQMPTRAAFEYTISANDDSVAHLADFGVLHLGKLLRWVVLLGGCQEVTRCRGWALVASRLELPLDADLHLQHVYIIELLHQEKHQQQRLQEVLQQQLGQHRALLSQQGPSVNSSELLSSRSLLLPQPSAELLPRSCSSLGSTGDELLQAGGMLFSQGMMGQPSGAFLLPLGQVAQVVAPHMPSMPVPGAAAPMAITGNMHGGVGSGNNFTNLLQPSILAMLPGDDLPGAPFARPHH